MTARGMAMSSLVRKVLAAALFALAAVVLFEVAYERTDAFRHGNGLYYRDGKATGAGRAFARFWTSLARVGLVPRVITSLETIGAKSGQRRAVPMVIGRHAGADYLVSMLGERSPWVHNVRAAGGRAWLRRGAVREVRLVEVPIAERAPVIRAYLGVAAGARPHIPVAVDAPLSQYEAIAAAYPVFRIEPVPA